MLGSCVEGPGQSWRHIGSRNPFPDFCCAQDLKKPNDEICHVAKTCLGAPCVSIQDICVAQRRLEVDYPAGIVCNEDNACDFPRFLKKIIECLYLFSTDWVRTTRDLMKKFCYTPLCLEDFADKAKDLASKSENPVKDIMRSLVCRRTTSNDLTIEVVDIFANETLRPASLVAISCRLLQVTTLHGHRLQDRTPLRREYEMWEHLQIACKRLIVVQCLCAQIVEINMDRLPLLQFEGNGSSNESTINAYQDYLSHFSVPEEEVKRYIV